MRKVLLLVVAGTILAGFLSPPSALAGEDWQYWNQFTFKRQLGDKNTVQLSLQQRFTDDVSELTFWKNVGVTLSRQLTDWASLGLEYRFESLDASGDWRDEHRVSLVPTFRWSGTVFVWEARTNVERRNFEDETKWRLRERMRIKTKVRIGDQTISPFLSEEVFYDFDANKVNQNRVMIGTGLEIVKSLELILYYMNRGNRRDGDWSFTDIVGTEIIFSF